MKCNETFLCWLLALSLSVTNLTSGWTWITYASISDFTAQYYHVSLSQINWISLLYAVIMTTGCFPFIWFIDYYGVKLTMTLSAALNLLCAVIHFVSSSGFIDLKSRYTILVIGSVFGGLAQPLALFSSTKLAATWFPPESRVSANTLAAMGNPLGVLLSNLLSPMIANNQSKLPLLNGITLIPAIIGLFVVLIAVYMAPKRLNTSPTLESISMLGQIKICFRNVQFWVIVLSFGIILSIFTTISTLIQQILCPLGYSDMFSGVCGALFLAMGIPGVLVVGPIVARIRAMTEVVKWGLLFTAFGLISFSIASTLPGYHVFVAFSVSMMGLFGFGVYPTALELAAETAHPAGEVLSTGILIAISQLLSLIFVTVAQAISIPFVNAKIISACSIKDIRSYWISTMILAIIGVIDAIVFLFAFKTKYKRIQSETEWTNSRELYLPLVDADK